MSKKTLSKKCPQNERFAKTKLTLSDTFVGPHRFVYSVMGAALRLDALESTHPIEVPVAHPDEINEIASATSL